MNKRLLTIILIGGILSIGFVSCQGFFNRNDQLKKENDSLINALKIAKSAADTAQSKLAEKNYQPSFNDSLPILFKKVKKAVYLILTEKDSVISQGSCFVINKEGVAISNYHIFKNASGAIVINDDGEKFMVTEIMKHSEEDDYIVFKIGPSTNDFQFVEIAESSPDIGEQCFAIGNPESLSQTLSNGIISGYRENNKLIQTNTEITYGSSGGPLFNKSGKVIGITTMGSPEANLNFAVNINSIDLDLNNKPVAETQETSETYRLSDILTFLNSYYDLLKTENFDILYGKYAADMQPILYFDFELSDKQFESRYSKDFEEHYKWNENFLRSEIDPDIDVPENLSFEDFLSLSLERSIIETRSKILIIDNLTYLKSETEKAKDALPLMKHLKALKSKYGLSILALAHTPKRDLSKPITRNELSGSKMLMNFCDSSFAIGESHSDKSIRYFKQIKERCTEKIYDAENVCICQIAKPGNFLRFEFLNFGTEWEHLKQFTEKDKEQRISETLELKKQGVSNVDIARRFGVSEGAIRKWMKKTNATEIEKAD